MLNVDADTHQPLKLQLLCTDRELTTTQLKPGPRIYAERTMDASAGGL